MGARRLFATIHFWRFPNTSVSTGSRPLTSASARAAHLHREAELRGWMMRALVREQELLHR